MLHASNTQAGVFAAESKSEAGLLVQHDIKVKRSQAHAVFWNVRDLLPCMGYAYTSQDTKTCRTLSRLMRHWQPIWQELQISQDVYAASRKSLGQGAGEDSSAHNALTTPGVLSVLLHGATQKHAHTLKQNSDMLLKSIITKCTGADIQISEHVEPRDETCVCQALHPQSALCLHWLAVQQAGHALLRCSASDVGSKLTFLILLFWTHRGDCAGLLSQCRLFLNTIAHSIDAFWNTWCKTDLTQYLAPRVGPSGTRKLVRDEHVSELAASASFAKKRRLSDTNLVSDSDQRKTVFQSLRRHAASAQAHQEKKAFMPPPAVPCIALVRLRQHASCNAALQLPATLCKSMQELV